MRRSIGYWNGAACGLFLGIIALGMSPATEKEKSFGRGEAEEKCCYTNQRYQGVCVVTPGEGDTCAGILAYLNNPNSVGKTYCANTKVRKGWKQVPCTEESGVAQCRPAPVN